MPAIHENLKHLRQARGLTQAEVADAIAVTRQTVSSYESGRTQPDLDTLKRLAEVYQADLHDILYGGNRLQRRLGLLRRAACALAAVLLLGLFLHSALLRTANTYFIVAPGGVTEANRAILEIRFALLGAGETIVRVCTSVFELGCLVLLYPLIALERTISLRLRLGWLLGLTAAAFAVTAPWAMGDSLYGSVDYLLPLWGALPSALLAFLVPLAVGLIGRWKKRDRGAEG